eukprot:CAMPEP_0170498928 /NCGR_PEP_ID=MMETSP0208-20121228/29500_1 /TAXON_ID=197538 /ORGANISM="Strombidium inclinatum, Strain S3" /LENGTH=43 /DNA_ID= /DNA_START= /DNA_END= /DNA_ORIENTATION=
MYYWPESLIYLPNYVENVVPADGSISCADYELASPPLLVALSV